MEIKALKLINFRNYEEEEFEFTKTTVVEGVNGSGKTNLLEAIYLLSTTKSPQTTKNSELICRGQSFGLIKSQYILGQKEILLDLTIFPTRKEAKVGGAKKQLLEFLGIAPAVWFSPQSLEIILGSPFGRRRFFDLLLAQTSKAYAFWLAQLAKILAQRNRLLWLIKEGRESPAMLNPWNQKLVEASGPIMEERKTACLFLAEKIASFYQRISKETDLLSLVYLPQATVVDLVKQLAENQGREIAQAATLFGPHRDEFLFTLDDFRLGSFGSRGEIRSAVLALKLAEKEFLETKTHKTPILLWDDAFSELDQLRQSKVAALLLSGQTIITTTRVELIPKEIRGGVKVLSLQNGKLKKNTGKTI